jgi:ATP-binding cassette subfamily B multidrug efflux pump
MWEGNKMPEINQSYEKMPKLGKMGGGGPQRFAPKEKPKNEKGTVLRLLKTFMLWRKSMVVAMVLTILSSGISVTIPLLLGKAINAFQISTHLIDDSLLTTVLLVLLSCYLVGWVLDTINGVLMAHVTQKLVQHLRVQFFEKLQTLPLPFYDTRSHGDTMSRMTNDVDNISNTVSQTTTQLISSILSISGSLVMMLLLSPPLTLVAMVSIPLFLILTKTITHCSKPYFQGQQKSLGTLNGLIEESIVGLKLVKAFNRQEQVLTNFKSLNDELCGYSVKAQVWSGFMMPFMNVINNLSFALISGVGGLLAINGAVTVGTVVSFLSYSKQFGQPLNSIAGMLNNIQSALAGAERIFEIMDEAQEPADQEDAVALHALKGEVEFSKVSYSYRPGVPILNNVSFHVKPGTAVALVGETGAGKTTIVNLITRFYDLEEGQILIDGTELRKITRGSLQKCFSVVLQDTNLFSGSISDNIRYSRPDATDEEVREAAQKAHADRFIDRLPNRYETKISGSGEQFSQGQRQLLAIARAILCDAPILILDEATSNVDTKTEKEIQRALLNLMKGHTSFIIAHRLSTIRDADLIMVVGEGEILESGTHDELMRNRGSYYRMVMSQLGLEA